MNFRPFLAAIAIVAMATSAIAWKPKTHIYLADLALRSVDSAGYIKIFRVNRRAGTVLDCVGSYRVDPALFAAIKSNRKIFNAGVLGPDAFPDILTGQMIIHPENSWDTGSNAWLEQLWNAAQRAGPEEKAFAAGFLFHAAGDMFGHTYINHFAGGPFVAGNNALRHIIIEGYMGKLTPRIVDYDFDIDDTIRNFIYNNMINGALGTDLHDRLLVVAPGNPLASLSVPLVFSRLKNYLVQELAELRMPRANNDLLSGAKRAYIEHWIADVDSGLREWPYFSKRMAALLVYNTDESMSTATMISEVERNCNDYVNRHLLSMAGAPDFVGLARGQIQTTIDSLTEPIHEAISQIKASLRDALLQAVFHMTLAQIADYLNRPENYFDRVMGSAAAPPSAATITMQEFNDNELHRSGDGQWILPSFAPAYNTVLMTQLILLQKSEVERLITDLQREKPFDPNKPGNVRDIIDFGRQILARENMPEANAMLGFNFMLDNSMEWRVHRYPRQLVMVRAGVYDKLFLAEKGEDRPIDPRPRPVSTTRRVTVSITHVMAIDNVDPEPFDGRADFYARIHIGDRFLAFDTIQNANDIRPSWFLTQRVVGEEVPVQIELFDEDTGLAAPDDPCDINPAPNQRALHLFYNLKTGLVSGDAAGRGGQFITVRGAGDSDRCELTFRIDRS